MTVGSGTASQHQVRQTEGDLGRARPVNISQLLARILPGPLPPLNNLDNDLASPPSACHGVSMDPTFIKYLLTPTLL